MPGRIWKDLRKIRQELHHPQVEAELSLAPYRLWAETGLPLFHNVSSASFPFLAIISSTATCDLILTFIGLLPPSLDLPNLITSSTSWSNSCVLS
ncbi:hypothetical protein E2C01_027374 [Portunus trituberculatus]|uniref:Uncharacterized protein n=1 Tax=Portunus trituberculatus TaxID=210409 RepID=A0A5B7ELS4_PORTR|nr:hypothetical protein [Portunus trituberculatus]